MKTIVAALLSLSLGISAIASAETQPVQVQVPELTPQAVPQANLFGADTDEVKRQRGIGGVLLALSAGAAVSADIVGAVSIVQGICFDDCDSDNGGTASNGLQNAAIGLAVGAAITAAIGIPLVVAANNGSNAQKRKKARVSFSVSPTYGAQQGAGISASLGVRF